MSDETERKGDPKVLREKIELRAYFKYCERGCVDGLDVNDWLAAEREVRAERAVVAQEDASGMSAAQESGEPDLARPNRRERRPRSRGQTTDRHHPAARPMR